MKFPNFLSNQSWNELNRFKKLSINERKIVFYAENKASINHYRQLIHELTEKRNLQICYVTSVKDDPMLYQKNIKIKSFFIGEGSARIQFFITLDAKVLIMDMPDLDNFHIKKSKIYPVHYIYIFHSIFSTHTYLRNDALFNFDTIFCAGPHHIVEIKKTEELYSLNSKNLIEYGFGRVDDLLQKKNNVDYKSKLILITPTYGKNNLLEKCGIDLIKILLDSGYEVVLRPHFRIFNESSNLIKKIENEFRKNENFSLEKGVISNDLFEKSLCLITEWSGISFEYAFVFEKPVFFIDLPQKILNHDYDKLSIIPMEVENREKIGYIISINNLQKIIDIIKKNEFDILKNKIRETRSACIFNIGSSGEKGAQFIQEIIS